MTPGKQNGFTLPELLISLVLGLTLVGAVMSAYLTTLKSSGDNNEQAQLNHNLRASLDLILSDLKRAGGLGDDSLPATQTALQNLYANNPFNDSVSNLRLWDCNGANECSCVTYSYDEEGDNDPYNAGGAMNHFGFKLSGDRLQIRTGSVVAAGGAHPGCGYDAALNTWESLTEDDVQITQFAVSYIDGNGNILAAPTAINIPDGNACSAGDICIEERNLQVTISGTKDEFSLTVTGKVRVRNDRYIP
ncbi:PilW family protein [Oceanospirillum sanctuarii]|uniref:PilW family protein n=1 Tax=Oceanospirillum sanctuarii TaxID=1434821 RepID=UPI000A39A8B5|nr:prepilin-type N-terminal cleavage/methylation domain-containing protein [Oceanospirillum sanctuarii]